MDTNQNFHASVAVGRLKPYSLEQVWGYLQKGPHPDFTLKLDNIALMKKVDGKWSIEQITEIKPSSE